MDDALVLEDVLILKYKKLKVLILVLMDDALVLTIEKKKGNMKTCLNPCFNG